jgi:hypothetical protein
MSDIEQTIEMLKKQVCELQARNTDLNTALDLRDKQVQDLMRDRQKCWDHLRNIGFSAGVNQGGPLDEYVTQIRRAIEAKGTSTSDQLRIAVNMSIARLTEALIVATNPATGTGAQLEWLAGCAASALEARANALEKAGKALETEKANHENTRRNDDAELARLRDTVMDRENRLAHYNKSNDALRSELNDYHKNYKELYECMEHACRTAAIAVPSNVLKQECIIAAFNRLAEVCVHATADTRLNELVTECHSAESRAGIICRVQNPWKRVEMVLNQMSCELARMQVEARIQRIPEEVTKKLWAVLQSIDPTGASMAGEGGEWHDETSKAMALIQRIAEKAYEGQNIKAACRRLKELL